MATVSGTAVPNSSFPVIGIGAGGVARPPPIRDVGRAVGAEISGRFANQNRATQGAATGSAVEAGNGVRPGGVNGALLDLPTSLAAQESSGEEQVSNGSGLTEEEEEQVAKLREADATIRRHEAAHAAAGGAFAGAPTFTFEQGPDGRRYAVAGEVSIDASPVDGDPEATIRKLQIVRRAALAPADPSGQDRAVAAQAGAGIRQAQSELQAQRAEELTGEGGDSKDLGVTEASDTGGADETTPGTTRVVATQQPNQDDGAVQAGAAAARIIDIAV